MSRSGDILLLQEPGYDDHTAGATIFNCYSVEDVVYKQGRVGGVVVNWTPVLREGLHVDPLTIISRTVLDGTGHDCEIAKTVARKNGVKLNTPTGGVVGEMSMDAAEGERSTIDNTKEIYPGLFVSGMAANGVSGSFRMGPIFGGMLMSGKKAAELMGRLFLRTDIQVPTELLHKSAAPVRIIRPGLFSFNVEKTYLCERKSSA